MGYLQIIYNITPVPKPRMVRSDKWKKRPATARYWSFKDEIRAAGVTIPDQCKVTFYMPMPSSWSEKKKLEHDSSPHRAKPDYDNLAKALGDAVYDDDAHIWSVWIEKRWARCGAIEITEIGLTRPLDTPITPGV